MARINLLPWREELRKERQRQFLTLAGVALGLTVLAMISVHIYFVGVIDYREKRNAYVQNEIRQVEKKIAEIKELETQKEQLVARMRVIERLQRNRPEIVHIFDELVKLTPDGLYLTNMTQKGPLLILEGEAQSNARVSALMRNLDNSEWFDRPELKVIQKQGKEAVKSRKFTLNVLQASATKETEEQ